MNWLDFLAILVLALLSVMITFHLKWDAWDWYIFWTGGRRRRAIFEVLKPVARFLWGRDEV